jgi:hypothetical protein
MSSLDRILPFRKPIEDLLVDPAITEVMVNRRAVRLRGREVASTPSLAGRSNPAISRWPSRTLRACGDEISRQPCSTHASRRLTRRGDVPPCAVTGPILTIRKFTPPLLDELGVGTLTPAVAAHLPISARNVLCRWDRHGENDTAERPRGLDSSPRSHRGDRRNFGDSSRQAEYLRLEARRPGAVGAGSAAARP